MPTKEQKEFIRKKLIPFIRRDAGAGFDMATWVGDASYMEDEQQPMCGTAACIGGSIVCLMAMEKEKIKKAELKQGGFFQTVQKVRSRGIFNESEEELGKKLGLTPTNAYDLFYHWQPYEAMNRGWPMAHAVLFDHYDYGKEQDKKAAAAVACDLLEQIAERGDSVFTNNPQKLIKITDAKVKAIKRRISRYIPKGDRV